MQWTYLPIWFKILDVPNGKNIDEIFIVFSVEIKVRLIWKFFFEAERFALGLLRLGWWRSREQRALANFHFFRDFSLFFGVKILRDSWLIG